METSDRLVFLKKRRFSSLQVLRRKERVPDIMWSASRCSAARLNSSCFHVLLSNRPNLIELPRKNALPFLTRNTQQRTKASTRNNSISRDRASCPVKVWGCQHSDYGPNVFQRLFMAIMGSELRQPRNPFATDCEIRLEGKAGFETDYRMCLGFVYSQSLNCSSHHAETTMTLTVPA
jgi:hypothetical protein